MNIINRAGDDCIALETTLLVHGLPRGQGTGLARELAAIARSRSARTAVVGIIHGQPTVGLTDAELALLLDAPGAAPKANTANLGALMFGSACAATTVSTTMELAAAAGLRLFATGGLGGVHRGYGSHLDISSDLIALTRFPVAVVASGVKSILDVAATREALETLGIPVIGFQTDTFPAFYTRETDLSVDARVDDARELAAFTSGELKRSGRGILIANPIPRADAIAAGDWDRWLLEADKRVRCAAVRGRDVTPAVLSALHEISGGATLKANLALIRSNTDLAAQLCIAMLNDGG